MSEREYCPHDITLGTCIDCHRHLTHERNSLTAEKDLLHKALDLANKSCELAIPVMEDMQVGIDKARNLFSMALSFIAEEDITHYSTAISFREQATTWLNKYGGKNGRSQKPTT